MAEGSLSAVEGAVDTSDTTDTRDATGTRDTTDTRDATDTSDTTDTRDATDTIGMLVMLGMLLTLMKLPPVGNFKEQILHSLKCANIFTYYLLPGEAILYCNIFSDKTDGRYEFKAPGNRSD